jgi:hypothetical protein
MSSDTEIEKTIELLNKMLVETVDGKPIGLADRLKITDRLLKAYALKNKIAPDASGGKFGRKGASDE